MHQTSAKVSQVTNMFLPSRILAINVVLYAVKAFKNEMKHMNAKEPPRACAQFFTATVTTRALHNNNVSLRRAPVGKKVPAAANIQHFILTGQQQHGRALGASVSLDAWSRSEAPLCVSVCVSPLGRGSWRGQEGLTCEKLNGVQDGS